MQRSRIFALVLLAVAALPLWGVEPPRKSIADALHSGKVAFLAHAVKIELVSIGKDTATARMYLRLDRCYYGISCDHELVVMTYLSQSNVDATIPVYPVSFPVGQTILFVLNAPVQRLEYRFDSDLRGGADLAFLGPILPSLDSPQFDPYWTSVYWASSRLGQEKIGYEQIETFGAERALQLGSR